MERINIIEKEAENYSNIHLCSDCHAGATMLCAKNKMEIKCNMWKNTYNAYIQGYKDCLKFIKK